MGRGRRTLGKESPRKGQVSNSMLNYQLGFCFFENWSNVHWGFLNSQFSINKLTMFQVCALPDIVPFELSFPASFFACLQSLRADSPQADKLISLLFTIHDKPALPIKAGRNRRQDNDGGQNVLGCIFPRFGKKGKFDEYFVFRFFKRIL